MKNKRVAGIVEMVRSGDNDRGILTVDIGIKFEGFYQAFGGLMLDPPSFAAFKEDICKLFKVPNIEDVIGRSCFGLWCFGDHNETIEGIEVDGVRFTITSFRKRHWPERINSRLEDAFESSYREIAFCERRIKEERLRITTLEQRYTDWEAQ